MTEPPNPNPPLDQLADEDDTLGWDRAEHGTFEEHAAADDAVTTMDADAYLRKLGPVNGATDA